MIAKNSFGFVKLAPLQRLYVWHSQVLTILDEVKFGVAMLAPATSVYWRHSQTERDLSDWECLGKQGCCRDASSLASR